MAVLALHEMGSRCARSGRRRVPPCRLVLAGGYDERLAENREYYSELRSLVDALGLGEQVRAGHVAGEARIELSCYMIW